MAAQMFSPIYQVFKDAGEVGAAFTGKGISPRNGHFSFHRPSASSSQDRQRYFSKNLQQLAQIQECDPRKVMMPNGAWPHSGRAIKAEDYSWAANPSSKTLVPFTISGEPVVYDAIATRSRGCVIAAQGADCPTVFLYDPTSNVIGIAHAGWKPVVRGVIRNIITAMCELGAEPWRIDAYVSPGAGDRYNAFRWDDKMETYVKQVFVDAGRMDLLLDKTIRHDMDSSEITRLSCSLGRRVYEDSTLKLSELAERELEKCGLLQTNISSSLDSCIVDQYPEKEQCFKYHSYRRERPKHGLSMSVLFLKPR